MTIQAETVSSFSVIQFFVITLLGMYSHPAVIRDSDLVCPFVEFLRLESVAEK